MTTICAPLTDGLELEFQMACEEFARARAARRIKDTPAARQRVTDALSTVNAVLDARNARRTA